MAGALLALPGILHGDIVRLQSGEEVRGEIRKEAFRELTIAVQGAGVRSFPRRDIAPDGVVYEGEPRELREAKDALDQREFQKAHAGFDAVIAVCGVPAAGGAEGKKAEGKNGKGGKDKKARPGPKAAAAAVTIRPIFCQHAHYGKVRAYHLEGKAEDAIEAIDALLAAEPDTWHLIDVLLLKVEILSVKGDEARLKAASEDAVKRATAAGAGAEVGDRIKITRADQLVKQGKPAEAEKLYKEIERSPVRQVADKARLGQAQLRLAARDLVNARIAFNQILRDARDRPVLCSAARGLGDTQVLELEKNKTAEGLLEALESYLRAVLLHFPGDGDPTEPHQAAYLSAAKCAEELIVLSKGNAAAQAAHRKTARDLYAELQTIYRGTEAAKQAAAGLRRLQAGGQ